MFEIVDSQETGPIIKVVGVGGAGGGDRRGGVGRGAVPAEVEACGDAQGRLAQAVVRAAGRSRADRALVVSVGGSGGDGSIAAAAGGSGVCVVP